MPSWFWPGEREGESGGRMRRVSCLKRVNCWESFFFEKQRYLSLFLSLSLFLPLSHRVIIDDHDRDRGIGSSSSSSSSINSGGLLRVAAVAFDDELRRLLRCHHHCRIGVDGERRRNLSFSSLGAGRGRRPLPELLERRGRHLSREGSQKRRAGASKNEKGKK